MESLTFTADEGSLKLLPTFSLKEEMICLKIYSVNNWLNCVVSSAFIHCVNIHTHWCPMLIMVHITDNSWFNSGSGLKTNPVLFFLSLFVMSISFVSIWKMLTTSVSPSLSSVLLLLVWMWTWLSLLLFSQSCFPHLVEIPGSESLILVPGCCTITEWPADVQCYLCLSQCNEGRNCPWHASLTLECLWRNYVEKLGLCCPLAAISGTTSKTGPTYWKWGWYFTTVHSCCSSIDHYCNTVDGFVAGAAKEKSKCTFFPDVNMWSTQLDLIMSLKW